MAKLGTDYLDLYLIHLIHWPSPKRGLYVETWKANRKSKASAAGVLAWDETEIRHELRSRSEASKVTDLGSKRDRGNELNAPHRLGSLNDGTHRPRLYERGDVLRQPLHSRRRIFDGLEIVGEHAILRFLGERLLAGPLEVLLRPRLPPSYRRK